MPHVFISHSTKDDEYADELVSLLKANEIAVWIDQENIHTGDYWQRVIIEAINSSAVMIIIMTPDAKESDNVQREIIQARNLGLNLFPVLLKGENWEVLGDTQYEDVRSNKNPKQKFFDDLKKHINSKKEANDVAELVVEHASNVDRTSLKRPKVIVPLGVISLLIIVFLISQNLPPNPPPTATNQSIASLTPRVPTETSPNTVNSESRVDVVRGLGVIAFITQSNTDLSALKVNFGNNEAYTLQEILPSSSNSAAGQVWCIMQPRNASRLEICQNTYTTPDTLNNWRNSDITLMRDNIIISECDARPTETSSFSCLSFNW